MERSYDEHVVMYFCKKNLSSSLLLLILGFGIVSVGINREDSYIFVIIGIVFGAMAVWMWIRQRFIKVKGTEVDEAAKKIVTSSLIQGKAMREFELDEEDVDGLDKLILQGYSPLSINTEPLFRVDEEDSKARSSNYQATYFMLDETIMFTYSQVRSLVDSESFEGGHVWRYKAIIGSRITDIPRLCMTAPEKEEGKIEKAFSTLVITGENKETFSFAFCEDDRETAEYINDYINKRIMRENRMRKPGKSVKPPVQNIQNLTKKERKSVEIGVIGDEMKKP